MICDAKKKHMRQRDKQKVSWSLVALGIISTVPFLDPLSKRISCHGTGQVKGIYVAQLERLMLIKSLMSFHRLKHLNFSGV